MAYHDNIAELNGKYAASFDKGDLPLPPSKKVIVCKLHTKLLHSIYLTKHYE